MRYQAAPRSDLVTDFGTFGAPWGTRNGSERRARSKDEDSVGEVPVTNVGEAALHFDRAGREHVCAPA